ncbi:MAG: hypothetical protein ABIP29_07080 [Candidatus Eisenbacteria bacterium]
MHDNTNAPRRLFRSLGLAVVLTLGLALVSAALARLAHADTPDPRYCVAQPVLVSAPGGGFDYTVTLRDGTNQPVAGGTAILDFNVAPGILVCDDQDPDHDRRIVGTANSIGVVTFRVRAGGTGAGTLEVIAATSVIATVSVRTMDFDGDMDVDQADRDALVTLLGTAGPAGDFDRNGIVDASDQSMLEQRYGGNCALLPVRAATWGNVKGLYR